MKTIFRLSMAVLIFLPALALADGTGSHQAAGKGAGGSMVYPAAGIPCSTGSAWCASTVPGTGVLAALAVNVGSLGAFITNGGALGTPSSATLTNATGLPVSGLSGLGTGVNTFLGAGFPASANCIGTNSSSQPTAGCPETVNAQTGTAYTVSTTDCGRQVTFSNSASIAVTLPQATGSFASCQIDFTDIGTGTATITPTASTINGSASIAVAQNRQCTVNSDGTNWQVPTCTALVSSGGSPAFSAITTGKNTTATMEVGAGATLEIDGSSTGSTAIASANASATNYTATLPANTGTIAETNLSQNWVPKQTFGSSVESTFNAGPNQYALIFDGTPSSTGTGTTNIPLIYEDPATTAPTTFSLGGTYFGINAFSGFTGNFVDYYINGVEKSSLSSTGTLNVAAVASMGTTFTLGTGTGACASTSGLVGGPSVGKFSCTGTTGASTIIVNLPTATDGWVCDAHDITTTSIAISESADTTTSVTFSGNVTANDVLLFKCEGF